MKNKLTVKKQDRARIPTPIHHYFGRFSDLKRKNGVLVYQCEKWPDLVTVSIRKESDGFWPEVSIWNVQMCYFQLEAESFLEPGQPLFATEEEAWLGVCRLWDKQHAVAIVRKASNDLELHGYRFRNGTLIESPGGCELVTDRVFKQFRKDNLGHE